MNLAKPLFAATGALLLVGCTPSLDPLFTARDIVFEPELAGTWADKDGNTFLSKPSTAARSYEVVYTDKEQGPARFEARLGQIGGLRFLDLYPEEPQVGNDFYRGHLVRAHTFGRIWTAAETIRISMLDADWLDEMVRAKKLSIPHHFLGKDLLLTASTRELQALVLKYADDPKAFPEPVQYKRHR